MADCREKRVEACCVKSPVNESPAQTAQGKGRKMGKRRHDPGCTIAPLSQEAIDFADRVFKCEPPCDSLGVCSECCEESVYLAGYDIGYRAALGLTREQMKAKFETEKPKGNGGEGG